VFKIASIEQNRFLWWTIRPVRVRIVEGRGGRACGESADGREEDVTGSDGGGGERTKTAKEGESGGGRSGGCGEEGAREGGG